PNPRSTSIVVASPHLLSIHPLQPDARPLTLVRNASPHLLSIHPLQPDARPLTLVRNAFPHPPNTSSAPTATLVAETSPAWLGSIVVPHSRASSRLHLACDIVSTAASLAGNSHPVSRRRVRVSLRLPLCV